MFICLLAIIACAYASFGGGGGGGGGGLNIGALLQQVKQIWNSQLRYRKISWMHWNNFQRGQSKSFRNFRLFSISEGIEFCVTRKKNLTDIFPKKNYRTLIFEKMLLTSNGFCFFSVRFWVWSLTNSKVYRRKLSKLQAYFKNSRFLIFLEMLI